MLLVLNNFSNINNSKLYNKNKIFEKIILTEYVSLYTIIPINYLTIK